jgi:hypothetical protein
VPTITPRTAKVLHHCATLLADEVFDEADTRRRPHRLSDSAALPPIARAQLPTFYRQMARAYDDLAADLAAGRLPQPSCIAEEIALNIVIDMASEVCEQFISDGLIAMNDVAASAYDFAWDRLQAVLVHGTIIGSRPWAGEPAPPGSLDHWFEECYGNSRDPERGFRR